MHTLILNDIELTDKGILIKEVSMVDKTTGEILRAANLTPQLVDFLGKIEIDTYKYQKILRMCEQNPNLKELISTFDLTTI